MYIFFVDGRQGILFCLIVRFKVLNVFCIQWLCLDFVFFNNQIWGTEVTLTERQLKHVCISVAKHTV